MWRCEDVKMWRCEDVKMRRCEDEKMWWQTSTIRRTLRSDALGKNMNCIQCISSYFKITCLNNFMVLPETLNQSKTWTAFNLFHPFSSYFKKHVWTTSGNFQGSLTSPACLMECLMVSGHFTHLFLILLPTQWFGFTCFTMFQHVSAHLPWYQFSSMGLVPFCSHVFPALV